MTIDAENALLTPKLARLLINQLFVNRPVRAEYCEWVEMSKEARTTWKNSGITVVQFSKSATPESANYSATLGGITIQTNPCMPVNELALYSDGEVVAKIINIGHTA